MIFKRREKLPFWSRVWEALYPRKGWWRPFDYVRKRVRRLPDTPERIALGFACGAFTSFTPFFGFHFVIAGAIAWTFGGNILAALLGTIVGNPVTFPFIAAAALNLGWLILGTDPVEDAGGFSFSWLWDNLDQIFLPYLVGCILPGLIVAVVAYWVSRPIVAAYQQRRRAKLAAKAERRREEAAREQEAYAMHDSEGDNA